jgi:hypothetical protein
MRRVSGNEEIGVRGERAIAEAIAINEDTALTELWGFRLCKYLDVLGVSDEFTSAGNSEILSHLREMRLSYSVKSARVGGR